jgi:hypothetical protein
MERNPGRAVLIEGEDYYYENGLMVFTAGYHLRRGYCCERGCRHCPYGYSVKKVDLDAQPKEAHR